MPPVHRQGDPNTEGGIAQNLQSTVFANSLLVAVDGTGVTPHFPFIPPHLAAKTASGSSTVFAEGIPVNREGDADTCGHARAAGSPNVIVGG